MIRPLVLVLLALPFVPFAATAAALDIEVTHPTVYTDGSPLPVVDLSATRIQMGTCANATSTPPTWGALIEERIIPATMTVTTFDLLTDSTTYCVRGFTRVTSGAESFSSLVIAKTTPTPPPPEPKRPRRPGLK